MDQDEVIRRLKGLGRTPAPPAPDFINPLRSAGNSRGARFGAGTIAAVVGVMALGTAALAVPDNGPLRQVVASLSTEIESGLAEVTGDADANLDRDGGEVTGSASADPCEGPPPTGTEADELTDDATDTGVSGGATVDVDPEDREARVQAWREWREANCGPEDGRTDGDDDGDDPDGGSGNGGGNGNANGSGKGDGPERGEDGKPTHPHEDDPCKGPPPHADSRHNPDSERESDERRAQQEAWKQWHQENCPPGKEHDHPGHNEGHGKPDDAGRPEDAGKPDGAGRPDGAGKPDDGEDDGF